MHISGEHLLSTPEPQNSTPSTGTKKFWRTGATSKCSQWSLNDGPSFILLLSENIHSFKESTQLPIAPPHPCWYWESKTCHTTVCKVTSSMNHKHQGGPKRAAAGSFYQFQPNTSHLSQSGFTASTRFQLRMTAEPGCHSLSSTRGTHWQAGAQKNRWN